ncbi:hypothetical protein ACLOJK_040422 [Asimina triloba]
MEKDKGTAKLAIECEKSYAEGKAKVFSERAKVKARLVLEIKGKLATGTLWVMLTWALQVAPLRERESSAEVMVVAARKECMDMLKKLLSTEQERAKLLAHV